MLITKSGRRGSNPRRPAWEIGAQLNINGFSVYFVHFWSRNSPANSRPHLNRPLNGVLLGTTPIAVLAGLFIYDSGSSSSRSQKTAKMSHCQDEYGASGNLINDSIIAVNNTEETLKNRGTFVKIVMMGSGALGGYFDARLAAVG